MPEQDWISFIRVALHQNQGEATIFGLVLILFGIFYLRRPNIYRRGIWLKTSIAIRMLSEENYRRYIRGLGIAFIAIGAALLLMAYF